MMEYLPEAGYGRSVDFEPNKTVGQRGRHTRISNKARTGIRVNQICMIQGRAKKEKGPMTEEEVVCVGVDIAKNILDVAVSNLNETIQI